MTNKEKNDLRNQAWKEDRERFFKVTDKYLAGVIPLDEDKLIELKACVKVWRDISLMEGYPDIDFPLSIPSWLKVNFMSSHTKGVDEFGETDVNN